MQTKACGALLRLDGRDARPHTIHVPSSVLYTFTTNVLTS